jgi:hypothetical protein
MLENVFDPKLKFKIFLSDTPVPVLSFLYRSELTCYWYLLTINVPLFKKLRDIIFFWWDNHFMSHFEGHFEGSKKSRPPQNVPRNGS